MNFNERFEAYLEQDWFQDEAIFNEAILDQDKQFRGQLIQLMKESSWYQMDDARYADVAEKVGKMVLLAVMDYMPEPERDSEFISEAVPLETSKEQEERIRELNEGRG